MVELATFKRSYLQIVALPFGFMAFLHLGYGALLAYWLWRHDTGFILLWLFVFLTNTYVLIGRGIQLFWVKWGMPAVWIANERLYALSPLRFRMPMDDIVSWRLARHSWNGVMQHNLVLTDRKGKQRSVYLNVVADRDLLAARLTHILGPQTLPAAAGATAGA
jgi:hypothetical protein